MNKIAGYSVLILGSALVLYNQMPVIGYGFFGFPLFVFAFIGVIFFIHNSNAKSFQEVRFKKLLYVMVFAFVMYIFVLPMVTTWALFHTSGYRNLIGNIDSGGDLAQHIAPISIDQIRVVDQPLANLLGEKVLGSQPALGSQVHLGTFNIQKVKDQLYWVAPLVHSGFFKWNRNKAGTPGYVMVSATNERDVKLVQQVNGSDVKIKYQPDAYFGSYLQRHLYFNGYATKGLTDYSFELDDSGKPYWVVTTFMKTIGFAGDDAIGVAVVDAQTGDIVWYSVENAPLWVDRIQPAPFIQQQLNDWGEYVKGYWNFSNENKLTTTEEVILVYGHNNRAYWYTGLTSVGADESTTGFVLVDTRSKKAVWYKQSGATEFAAQSSAMGKVQEKGFYASVPIPYNVNGLATYVMTLKDKGGLVKMYAMVSIRDYTIVGVGNTLRETLMAYKNAFNMTGNSIRPGQEAERTKVLSVIQRISGDVKNGNSFYFFTLKDFPGKLFTGSSQVSLELPLTEVNDSVEVVFDADNQESVDVAFFNNLKIGK